MDASAISAIMNMQTVQSLNSQSSADSLNSGGTDFAGMLSSMMGMNSGMAAINADGTVNYAALLSSMTGGLTWQDVQSQMLMQTLHDMTQADKPLVTDPVLAQLLQQMDGTQGENAQSADMAALVKQIQDRLRDMLDEEGAAMAGQEALAVIGNLVPVFSVAGTSSAAQALTAGGGEAALQAMLETGPQRLMEIFAGQSASAGRQSQQNTQVQQSAQPQASPEVLPQGASAASTAQQQFASVAQAAQQPNAGGQASVPQSTVPVSAIPAEAAAEITTAQAQQATPTDEVQVQAGGAQTQANAQQLSQMLQTGQAQGSFAGAVRAVKEQMPASDGETPSVDVDELQKQVDGVDLSGRVQTSDIVRAAEQMRGAQQSVPAQLQQAVARGIENGQERLVVKLNPEDLGEVTLEMRKTENGGFTLSIIAKNPETQRMLAGDMAQLQQSLRPLRVEVQSIVTQQQFQMETGGQQFGGQHQRTWQEMHGAAYYGDEDLQAGEAPVAQPVAAAPQSALDAYI